MNDEEKMWQEFEEWRAGSQYAEVSAEAVKLLFAGYAGAGSSIADKREWPTALDVEPPEGVDLVVIDEDAGWGPWIARWNATQRKFVIAQPGDVLAMHPGAQWQIVDHPGLQRPEPPEPQP